MPSQNDGMTAEWRGQASLVSALKATPGGGNLLQAVQPVGMPCVAAAPRARAIGRANAFAHNGDQGHTVPLDFREQFVASKDLTESVTTWPPKSGSACRPAQAVLCINGRPGWRSAAGGYRADGARPRRAV